jgi:hypothetical protein
MREAGWRTFATPAEAQADYDRKLALKVDSLVGFVRETQPEEWAKIEGLYGSHTQERFIKRLCDELEPHDERGGVVNVLRHGIRMAPGAQFRLCFPDGASVLTVPESPMFNAPEAAVVTEPRLALVRQAGRQYAQTGDIDAALVSKIGSPMILEEQYAAIVNGGAQS